MRDNVRWRPDVATSVETLKTGPYFKTYDHPIEMHLGIFDPDGTRTELIEPHIIDGCLAGIDPRFWVEGV